MNPRQLETFRAVMVSGSASRAAELLGITQPAVSRSIVELERAIGFQLFDRSRGRLAPTREAELFLLEVERSFVGLRRLQAEVARIRDFGSGSLRIASLAALGATLVPHAIAAFLKRHPDIALTLQIHSSAQVRALVESGTFDLGLAADEVDVTGIEHRLFGRSRAACAIPVGDTLASKAAIRPADLHGRPFIALAPEDRARARLDQLLNAEGVRPRVVVETPNSSTVCALASAGVGIGLINPAAVRAAEACRVVLRAFEPAIEFRSVLLFRSAPGNSRLVKRMVFELLKARPEFGVVPDRPSKGISPKRRDMPVPAS